MKKFHIITPIIIIIVFLAGCSRKQEYPFARGNCIPSGPNQAIGSESGRYILTTSISKSNPDWIYFTIMPWKPDGSWIWSSDMEFHRKANPIIMWDKHENVWVFEQRRGLWVWEKDKFKTNWLPRHVNTSNSEIPDCLKKYLNN